MGLFGRDSQPSPSISQPLSKPGPSPVEKTEATVVARGSRIEGTLSGAAGVAIDGEFEGVIAITGNLQVSTSGDVKATVRARTVSVSGTVTGDISADEKIFLEASAVVAGNLRSPRILIIEGANLQGKVDMKKPPAQKEKKDDPAAPKAPEVTQSSAQRKKKNQ